jgi:MFS family permease
MSEPQETEARHDDAQPGSIMRVSTILAVVVAALGYFVDIFDLLLFAMVRKESLREVLGPRLDGLDAAAQDLMLRDWGVWLDNTLQTSGLVVGGVIWGVLGDRRGRLSVLFGSMLLYSVANVLNGFIADVDAQGPLGFLHWIGCGSAIRQYEVLRVVAGIGLAGELGAGITLVSELVTPDRRGVATTVVAAVGICGAIAGYFVTQAFTWRTSFLIGGGLGLGLLALRFGVVESGMFSAVRRAHRPGRGAVWRLLWPRERLVRYLSVVLIALPIWYVVGVCVKYSDVITRSMGIAEGDRPVPGRAIMWCYVGLAMGDLCSGLASQWWRSRRAAVAAFLGITALGLVGYFLLGRIQPSLGVTYAVIVLLGFGIGYWAVFVTTAAEHFGTDLRATAATTAPNLVRWSAAGSGALWLFFERWIGIDEPSAPWQAAAITGLVVMGLAVIGWFGLRETYGTSLDWTED